MNTSATLKKLLPALILIVICGLTKADDTLPDLIAKVEPSILKIETNVARGSGFVIDGGLVVTNRHVLEDATVATVHFKDGRTFDVEGILFDGKALDLCVIRCKGLTSANSTPLTISTTPPRQGARVFTFGTPRGLDFSVSEGIISATRIIDGQSLVQTTAPISSGNSGGPLLSTHDGSLIGINTWTRTDGQNLNFAIAASELEHAIGKSSQMPTPLNLTRHEGIDMSTRISPELYQAQLDAFWKQQLQAERDVIQKEIVKTEEYLSKASSPGTAAAIQVNLANLKYNHAVAYHSLKHLAPDIQLSKLNDIKIGSYGFIQEGIEVHYPSSKHDSLIILENSTIFYKLEGLTEVELMPETIIEAKGLPPMYISGVYQYTSLLGDMEVFCITPIPNFDKAWGDFVAEQEKSNQHQEHARDAAIAKAKTRTWTSGQHQAEAQFNKVRLSPSGGNQVVLLRKSDNAEIIIPLSALSSDDKQWIVDYSKTVRPHAPRDRKQEAIRKIMVKPNPGIADPVRNPKKKKKR